MRNAAVDLVRRRGRTVPLESEDGIFDDTDDPRRSAEKKEFQERVSAALDKLPQEERETIVQHLFAGLTFREISEIQNTPLGTVTARFRRGTAKLREEMEE